MIEQVGKILNKVKDLDIAPEDKSIELMSEIIANKLVLGCDYNETQEEIVKMCLANMSALNECLVKNHNLYKELYKLEDDSNSVDKSEIMRAVKSTRVTINKASKQLEKSKLLFNKIVKDSVKEYVKNTSKGETSDV